MVKTLYTSQSGDVGVGTDISDKTTFTVTIEIPKGSRNKYEVDHETVRLHLDRTLFTAMGYPADYGFIDDTLGQDGDPLDALLLIEESVFPGCAVSARPIAMMVMTDEHGPDAKILCVPDDIRYDSVRNLDDVSEFTKSEIVHFFAQYKTLEPGKHVDDDIHWEPLDKALAEIRASFERAQSDK